MSTTEESMSTSGTPKTAKEMQAEILEQLRGMNARITTVEERTRYQQERTKEQVKDAVEEEINEATEALKKSRLGRFAQKLTGATMVVVRELKPGVPNHDHVKGGVIVSGGTVLTARYMPYVGPVLREGIINLVTP